VIEKDDPWMINSSLESFFFFFFGLVFIKYLESHGEKYVFVK